MAQSLRSVILIPIVYTWRSLYKTLLQTEIFVDNFQIVIRKNLTVSNQTSQEVNLRRPLKD